MIWKKFDMLTDVSILDKLNALLQSNKPKIIVGSFDDKSELTEEQIRHFKTAEYLWHLHPHDKEGPYKGMHMGVLLDEKLNYVHIVFGSIDFVNQTSDGKILK